MVDVLAQEHQARRKARRKARLGAHLPVLVPAGILASKVRRVAHQAHQAHLALNLHPDLALDLVIKITFFFLTSYSCNSFYYHNRLK